MKKIYNIAVVGLGQVGIYLLNELNHKKKGIQIKTGTKINVVAISAKNIKKKENLKLIRKFFILILLMYLKNIKLTFYLRQ